MKSLRSFGRIVSALGLGTILTCHSLAAEAQEAPQVNLVQRVEVQPAGSVYIHFKQGTLCTKSGYIINGGGAYASQIVQVALAAMLSGRSVELRLNSYSPSANRCSIYSLTLI